MSYKILNEGTKASLRWIVDRRHVADPLHAVGQDIRRRSRRGDGDRTLLAEAILYARRHHLDNREEYRWIQRGLGKPYPKREA